MLNQQNEYSQSEEGEANRKLVCSDSLYVENGNNDGASRMDLEESIATDNINSMPNKENQSMEISGRGSNEPIII